MHRDVHVPDTTPVAGRSTTFAHGGKGDGRTRMLGKRSISKCLEWCQSTHDPRAGGNTGYMCRCCNTCLKSLAMRSPCTSCVGQHSSFLRASQHVLYAVTFPATVRHKWLCCSGAHCRIQCRRLGAMMTRHHYNMQASAQQKPDWNCDSEVQKTTAAADDVIDTDTGTNFGFRTCLPHSELPRSANTPAEVTLMREAPHRRCAGAGTDSAGASDAPTNAG